jgi:hypothetical protein
MTLGMKLQNERRFEAIGGGPQDTHLISSAIVGRRNARDVVRVWSRGVYVGELELAKGDGAKLALQRWLGPRP